LGSVVGLVNSAGVKVNTYSYDPYGINRGKTENVPNPYEYTGSYLDTNLGLYKLGIRYYDPTLGRFTQPDPTRQEQNSYAYASNTPASSTDVDGACNWFCRQKAKVLATGAALAFSTALAGLLSSIGSPPPLTALLVGAAGGCAGGAYYAAFTGGSGEDALNGCLEEVIPGALFGVVARFIPGIDRLFAMLH
jgi:RHS repeat-associated protein